VQRIWPNARAFDEFRSHLVTVGRIDQMRSAFGQTRSTIGQMRTQFTKRCADWSNAPYIKISGVSSWAITG